MNENEQRIAIAKVCPHLFIVDGGGMLRHPNKLTGFDPLTNLDAMHEAVKTLPQEIRPRYFVCLCSVVSTAISAYGYSEATEATAAQRAEAFLRTLGLWVDAPNESKTRD